MAKPGKHRIHGSYLRRPARRRPTGERQRVELVDGSMYWSDDHWVTVYKAALGGLGGGRQIRGREADRVRYIALVQHGGGRDEPGP